uniref:Nascent polypeptide-associated complex subunit alpha, muscle-specific form-like n=1 Tax=Phascolarctos cinereus TaxID=38626 RepID=A0A6P5KW79_PHACI|nr:nascent polypeptide-associated complex subunit alpha, muscle-specific form-like [Phascolarctos cinereus]
MRIPLHPAQCPQRYLTQDTPPDPLRMRLIPQRPPDNPESPWRDTPQNLEPTLNQVRPIPLGVGSPVTIQKDPIQRALILGGHPRPKNPLALRGDLRLLRGTPKPEESLTSRWIPKPEGPLTPQRNSSDSKSWDPPPPGGTPKPEEPRPLKGIPEPLKTPKRERTPTPGTWYQRPSGGTPKPERTPTPGTWASSPQPSPSFSPTLSSPRSGLALPSCRGPSRTRSRAATTEIGAEAAPPPPSSPLAPPTAATASCARSQPGSGSMDPPSPRLSLRPRAASSAHAQEATLTDAQGDRRQSAPTRPREPRKREVLHLVAKRRNCTLHLLGHPPGERKSCQIKNTGLAMSPQESSVAPSFLKDKVQAPTCGLENPSQSGPRGCSRLLSDHHISIKLAWLLFPSRLSN